MGYAQAWAAPHAHSGWQAQASTSDGARISTSVSSSIALRWLATRERCAACCCFCFAANISASVKPGGWNGRGELRLRGELAGDERDADIGRFIVPKVWMSSRLPSPSSVRDLMAASRLAASRLAASMRTLLSARRRSEACRYSRRAVPAASSSIEWSTLAATWDSSGGGCVCRSIGRMICAEARPLIMVVGGGVLGGTSHLWKLCPRSCPMVPTRIAERVSFEQPVFLRACICLQGAAYAAIAAKLCCFAMSSISV